MARSKPCQNELWYELWYPIPIPMAKGKRIENSPSEKENTQFNTKLSQWKKMVNELRAFGSAQRPLDHGLHVGGPVALLAPAHDAPRPARRPFS